MSDLKLKRKSGVIEVYCDCGAIHYISKDDDGNLVLETEEKKEDKKEKKDEPKKSWFDEL